MKPIDLDDVVPPEPDAELLARVHARSASFHRRRRAQQWTGAVSVLLVLALAGGVAWARVGSDHGRSLGPAAATTTIPASRVTRGELLGWHTMAYLASNRASATIEVSTQAAAAVIVGTPTSVLVTVFPLGQPVWTSIDPTRLVAAELGGPGRITVDTDGCPAFNACELRPLYTSEATPIPAAPPGGVVTKLGFTLNLGTAAIEPGRYDITLPIRYASSAKRPTVLDVTDTLHVRIDVTAQAPPSSSCTDADLHRPNQPVTAPHVLTSTIAIEHGQMRIDPPPRGFRPRVSAARAQQLLLANRVGTGGGAGTIVLASLSQDYPRSVHFGNGTSTPDTHNVVAWVLYTQRSAVIPPEGPPGGAGGQRPTSEQPCVFLDGITAVNATSGAQMDSAGFTSDAVPIHF